MKQRATSTPQEQPFPSTAGQQMNNLSSVRANSQLPQDHHNTNQVNHSKQSKGQDQLSCSTAWPQMNNLSSVREIRLLSTLSQHIGQGAGVHAGVHTGVFHIPN